MRDEFVTSLFEDGAAVIGAGNMGSGIAQKLAQVGIPVVLCDRNIELAENGKQKIASLLGEAVKRKIFTREKAGEILARVRPVEDLRELRDTALVIEAVFEDAELKISLFSELDAICDRETIFATNTSSLSVNRIGAGSGRPDRFGGLHFFYHPAKNRLLEVIAGEGTSPATDRRLMKFAKLADKVAIRTTDRAGFAVNRFFVPWLNEAVRLLEEGIADIPTIEAVAKEAFGCGMGPFQLMNATGVPIAFHAASSLGEALGPFYYPAAALASRADGGLEWDTSGEPGTGGAGETRDRLLGCVFTIAAALTAEGVATREDTDRGAALGLRWREGPFQMMNRMGTAAAYELAAAFAERYPDLAVPGEFRKLAAAEAPWPLSYVDLKVRDSVATITINRPEALNALNPTVMDELSDRFDEATRDPEAEVILLEGVGKAFVAGADIRFFIDALREGDFRRIRDFTEQGQEVFGKIADSKKRTIALVDGLALGGGAELALACQKLIVGPKASFAFPETGLGIYPALGGTQRLPRKIGKELAKQLILTGNPLSAVDALAIGFADGGLSDSDLAALDDKELEARVVKLAAAEQMGPFEIPGWAEAARGLFSDENTPAAIKGEIALAVDSSFGDLAKRALKHVSYKAPVAVRTACELIDEGYALSVNEGIELELERLETVFGSEDAMEGLTSVGKRRPEFKGR